MRPLPTKFVSFHFVDIKPVLTNRNKLKLFINYLFINEKKSLKNLSYIFCSDQYLVKLNQTHLNHSYYTDIITFPLSEIGHPIVSDIYISTERVQENAAIFATSFKKELHRVVFHGALHLCGYSDKTQTDKKICSVFVLAFHAK